MRYVGGFATVAKALHQLTEKGREFIWTEDCQTAFNTLKHWLITAPISSYPLHGLPLSLTQMLVALA